MMDLRENRGMKRLAKRPFNFSLFLLLFILGLSFSTSQKVQAADLSKVVITQVGKENGKYLNVFDENRSFPQNRFLNGSELFISVRFTGTPKDNIVFSVNGKDIQGEYVKEISAVYNLRGSTRTYAIKYKDVFGESTTRRISSLYVTAKDHLGQQYFAYLNEIKIVSD